LVRDLKWAAAAIAVAIVFALFALIVALPRLQVANYCVTAFWKTSEPSHND